MNGKSDGGSGNSSDILEADDGYAELSPCSRRAERRARLNGQRSAGLKGYSESISLV